MRDVTIVIDNATAALHCPYSRTIVRVLDTR